MWSLTLSSFLDKFFQQLKSSKSSHLLTPTSNRKLGVTNYNLVFSSLLQKHTSRITHVPSNIDQVIGEYIQKQGLPLGSILD